MRQAAAIQSVGDKRIGGGETGQLAGAAHSKKDSAEAQLVEAIKGVSEGVALFDNEDRLVVCNEKYRSIYPLVMDFVTPGVTFEAILRTSIERGKFPDAIGREDEWIQERIDRFRGAQDPSEHLLSDGRWYKISSRKTGSGGIVIFYTDITELAARSEALTASEQRFRDFAQTSSDWLWETGPTHRIAYVNATDNWPSSVDLSGIKGRTWPNLIESLGGDKTAALAVADRMSRCDPFRGLEFRVKAGPNGEDEHWLCISATPFFCKEGQLEGYRGGVADISRQKRVEFELRESQERTAHAQAQLIDAIESIPEGFVLFDRDDHLVVCNDRFRDTYSLVGRLSTGLSCHDFLEGIVESGLVEPNGQTADHWIKAQIERHRTPAGSSELALADGTWLEVRERRTEDGGTVGVHTSITERKLAEQDLAAQRALLTGVLDASLNATMALDLVRDENGKISDFRIRLVNDAAHSMLNRPRDSLEGKSLREEFPGARDAGLYDLVVDVVENGQPRREEMFYDADGVRGWFEVVAVKRSDGLVVTISAIDARKDRESALRREALIFEQISDAVIMIDFDGRIVDWSPGAEKIFGYGREEILGQPVSVLVADDGNNNENQAWEGLVRFRAKDGHTGTCETVNVPFFDERENVTATISVSRDITARATTEEQLRQAQKMEALGNLTGGVAHDFNNLLTVILGFTKMAMRNYEDQERMRNCLEEVVKASDKAATLTTQLLAFSRKQVLEPKAVPLAALIRDLESLLTPLLGEPILLLIEEDVKGVSAEVDPDQMAQAIVNLAINGRDAMPDGGRLTIGCGVTDVDAETAAKFDAEPGRYASVWVKDAGVGMEPDVLNKIFEPFFTTKEPGKGTGLGLSMAYGMVRQSKGVINVDSEPGAGTTVTIHLPLVEGSVVEEDKQDEMAAYSERQETILIIEDEPAVRELARLTLEERGYDVLVARDGGDAVGLHSRHKGKIDLVLTDVVMPGWGGPEVANAIRERRPDTKVIFMSGYPARGALHHHQEIGPDEAFIQKPFDPIDLEALVRGVLDGAA